MELSPIIYNTKPRFEFTLDEDHKNRLRYAANQCCIPLIPLEPHTGKCAIVGASASLKDQLKEIRRIQQDKFGVVISINGAHQFLIENDIIPNIHVLFEADLKSVRESLGGPPDNRVIYYTCSHLCSDIFDELKYYKKVIWHCFLELDGYVEFVSSLYPNQILVTGPYCSLFRTLTIGLILGFREIELFGCDASLINNLTHYEGYHNKADEPVIHVVAGTKETNKQFLTTPFLSFQAETFLVFCRSNNGLKIKIHGNGLMKYLHQSEFPEQYQGN